VSARLFNSAESNNPILNLSAGDYTLTIDAAGEATPAHAFRLFDLGAAGALPPGTPVSGELNPANESDVFQFTATAGDRFSFDLSARTNGGNSRWRLIDPYGNVLFNTSFNSTTSSDVATTTLTQAGNYALLIEGSLRDTVSGTYTFNVVPQGNVPQPPPTGAALVLGTTVSNAISVAGEQDRYILTLAQASLLYFDALTNNGNLNWTLVGPAGTAVNALGFTTSDSGSASGPSAINVAAGTYVLTVAASGTNTGDYSFRLSDLSQASPLTPGSPVSGSLDPANETDLYRFDAAAGGQWQLRGRLQRHHRRRHSRRLPARLGHQCGAGHRRSSTRIGHGAVL
jgi:hypothetical protein